MLKCHRDTETRRRTEDVGERMYPKALPCCLSCLCVSVIDALRTLLSTQKEPFPWQASGLQWTGGGWSSSSEPDAERETDLARQLVGVLVAGRAECGTRLPVRALNRRLGERVEARQGRRAAVAGPGGDVDVVDVRDRVAVEDVPDLRLEEDLRRAAQPVRVVQRQVGAEDVVGAERVAVGEEVRDLGRRRLVATAP